VISFYLELKIFGAYLFEWIAFLSWDNLHENKRRLDVRRRLF